MVVRWYRPSARCFVRFLAAAVGITALVTEPSYGQEVFQRATTPLSSERQTPFKIGVLAKRGPERCLEKWGPTAKYLTSEIPGYSFTVISLGYAEINAAAKAGAAAVPECPANRHR